jgi:hypothetical protein
MAGAVPGHDGTCPVIPLGHPGQRGLLRAATAVRSVLDEHLAGR